MLRKNDRPLCGCEMDGMCMDHLFCEEQRLLQLYQRSLKSNKSKMLTISYLCGLSRVYYDLDNCKACVQYGRKAEDMFSRLNIHNDNRVDNLINILQSYLVLHDYSTLETFVAACDKHVPAEHIPYKLLSQSMKERILLHKDDVEAYLAWVRFERQYCHDLKYIAHREEELIYVEAQTLYRLRCFLGAQSVMEDLRDFQCDEEDLPHDPRHDELEDLIERAMVDRLDIEEHPWNEKTICYNCWKVGTENGGRCAGCHRVHFCSQQCQNLSWPTHKEQCRSLRSEEAKSSVPSP